MTKDFATFRGTTSSRALYRGASLDKLAASAIVQAVTLSKNPSGYWRVGESAAPFLDSSGNGHSLVQDGTVTKQRPGFVVGDPNQLGIAVADVGPNNLRVNSAAFFGSLAALTVAAWILPTSYPHTDQYIARFGQGTDEQYGLAIRVTKASYQYYDGAFRNVLGPVVPLNVPSHIGFTRAADGVSIVVYLNGVGTTFTVPSVPTPPTGAQTLCWGNTGGTTAQQFQGGLQELFIKVGSALTPADFSDLYLAGKQALGSFASTRSYALT